VLEPPRRQEICCSEPGRSDFHPPENYWPNGFATTQARRKTDVPALDCVAHSVDPHQQWRVMAAM